MSNARTQMRTTNAVWDPCTKRRNRNIYCARRHYIVCLCVACIRVASWWMLWLSLCYLVCRCFSSVHFFFFSCLTPMTSAVERMHAFKYAQTRAIFQAKLTDRVVRIWELFLLHFLRPKFWARDCIRSTRWKLRLDSNNNFHTFRNKMNCCHFYTYSSMHSSESISMSRVTFILFIQFALKSHCTIIRSWSQNRCDWNGKRLCSCERNKWNAKWKAILCKWNT